MKANELTSTVTYKTVNRRRSRNGSVILPIAGIDDKNRAGLGMAGTASIAISRAVINRRSLS